MAKSVNRKIDDAKNQPTKLDLGTPDLSRAHMNLRKTRLYPPKSIHVSLGERVNHEIFGLKPFFFRVPNPHPKAQITPRTTAEAPIIQLR